MKKSLILFLIIFISPLLLMRWESAPTSAFALTESLKPGVFNPRVRMGLASWYSRKSPGIKKHTASNEVFDDRAMTCAIWGVPFDQKVKVTNLENGRSVILRVNDRGPHTRYVRKGRIIDLTKTAFHQIADTKKGLIKVSVEFL